MQVDCTVHHLQGAGQGRLVRCRRWERLKRGTRAQKRLGICWLMGQVVTARGGSASSHCSGACCLLVTTALDSDGKYAGSEPGWTFQGVEQAWCRTIAYMVEAGSC